MKELTPLERRVAQGIQATEDTGLSFAERLEVEARARGVHDEEAIGAIGNRIIAADPKIYKPKAN